MATKRIVLLLAITALLIAATAAPALALLPNGQAAPNFQLNDLSGNPHTLSEYRGKVVVIDFFGAQCGYCKSDAIDNLVPLYNTYYKNDAKVQFLGVEVDDYSAAAIQQYYQQPTGVSWPLLVNGGNVFSTYQASSTPTLYVISPAGNIAFSSTYPTNAQTVRSTIDALEGTTTLSAPAHLFVQGTDQALWTKYYQSASGWSGWQSLGGSLTSSPAATSPGSSSIDVFARGTDGAVWYKDWNGAAWSSWHSARWADSCRYGTRCQLIERRSCRRLCSRHQGVGAAPTEGIQFASCDDTTIREIVASPKICARGRTRQLVAPCRAAGARCGRS